MGLCSYCGIGMGMVGLGSVGAHGWARRSSWDVDGDLEEVGGCSDAGGED